MPLNGVVLAGFALVILRRDAHHGFGWAMAWLGLFWALDGLSQSYVRVGLSEDQAFPGMTFALWFLLALHRRSSRWRSRCCC